MVYKPESLLEVALLGNIVNKYKVNELAKDFGMQTKQIIEILSKYFDTPKKSGQNLDDRELTVIFEHLTQSNQIDSIQAIYADTPPAEKAKAAPPPRQEASRPAAPQQGPGRGQPQGGQHGPVEDGGLGVEHRIADDLEPHPLPSRKWSMAMR